MSGLCGGVQDPYMEIRGRQDLFFDIRGEAGDMSSRHRAHPPFRGAYYVHICIAIFFSKSADAYIKNTCFP